MSERDCRFRVDAFGHYNRKRVRITWNDRKRPSTSALEGHIENAWSRAVARCRSSKATLFNGQLVAWRGHRVADGILHIDAGPTNYRDFVGTNLYNGHLIDEVGRECFANPIGTTATIISSDGWLLYGRRSDRVAFHAGYLHTFGGAIEQADIQPDGTINPFAAVQRELAEELTLCAGSIRELVCVGLIHDTEIWQPELLFEAEVTLTRNEVTAGLGPDGEHQEHVGIEAVRDQPDALVPFVRGADPIAPVAVGAILLHGRRRWGQGWYEEAIRQV